MRTIHFNSSEYERIESTVKIKIKMVNEIIAYLKECEIELTPNEFRDLLSNEFSENKCEEISQSRFLNIKPKAVREYAREEFFNDLYSIKQSFGLIGLGDYLAYISFDDKKAFLNKKELQLKKEILTYTISNPNEIALHDLHLEICEKLSKFVSEAQKHNRFWSEYWFQLFTKTKDGFKPSEIKYS